METHTKSLDKISLLGGILFLLFVALPPRLTFALELSESEQLALELSGELLPPANLSARIQADLAVIRAQLPHLRDVIHTPKWSPGELTIILDDQNATTTSLFLSQLNASQYGPITASREISPGKFWVSFSQPYNPEVLGTLLRDEMGLSMTTPPSSFNDDDPLKNETITIQSASLFDLFSCTAHCAVYSFLRGSNSCTTRSGCSYRRGWIVWLNSKAEITTIAADWRPAPTASEAEQLALESGLLLAPPNLVARIETDLALIRTKFPAFQDFHHQPAWIPGELLFLDVDSELISKLNGSRFGPVVETISFAPYISSNFYTPLKFATGYDGLYGVTLSKPYNPDVLKEILTKEEGVGPFPGIPLLTERTKGEYAISLAALDESSGSATYNFTKGHEESCPERCSHSTFSVGLDGQVQLVDEVKEVVGVVGEEGVWGEDVASLIKIITSLAIDSEAAARQLRAYLAIQYIMRFHKN